MKMKKRAPLLILALICSFLLLLTASCAVTIREKDKVASPVCPVVEETGKPAQPPDKVSPERQTEIDKQERLKKEFETEAVYFSFNESFLTTFARTKIKEKAKWLLDNPTQSVRMEGHCDERGTNAYNLALGDRRANAVKKYLMFLGIPESRLGTVSYGEENPADPGHNEAAWSKNRRCEFKLTK